MIERKKIIEKNIDNEIILNKSDKSHNNSEEKIENIEEYGVLSDVELYRIYFHEI